MIDETPLNRFAGAREDVVDGEVVFHPFVDDALADDLHVGLLD
jgi:hypothetical protein